MAVVTRIMMRIRMISLAIRLDARSSLMPKRLTIISVILVSVLSIVGGRMSALKTFFINRVIICRDLGDREVAHTCLQVVDSLGFFVNYGG